MTGSWRANTTQLLTPIEAFDAMRNFLQAYWERGGRSSDDLAVLLGNLNRNSQIDTPPLDIAQWHDWLAAIASVKLSGYGTEGNA